MHHSPYSASTSVCMQQIANLSINNLRFSLQNLENAMAHEMHINFNFSKWRKQALLDEEG